MKFVLLLNSILLASAVSIYPNDTFVKSHFGRDITNILSKQNFVDIAQFILDNGSTGTYSNMYNNNPYYSYQDLDIYLNPINQFIEFIKSDTPPIVTNYNGILIRDINSRYTYYEIKLLGEKVLIYNPHKHNRNVYESTLLENYIPKLMSLINQS